jgi:hypothetical protein
MLTQLFPKASRQVPYDMFSLLLIGQNFTSPDDAVSTCKSGWEQAKGVGALYHFNDACAGAYAIGGWVEDGTGVGSLSISQSGNTLSIPPVGLTALDKYLKSTTITAADGTKYPASTVWPSFSRAGEFGSLIAIVVNPTQAVPAPAEFYQVSLALQYTRPIVAVVATGDWWPQVLARAVAQVYAGLGDEYEYDGSAFAQVPDNYWVPQTNILYVTAAQRSKLAGPAPDPVAILGLQAFPASWGVNTAAGPLKVWPHTGATPNPPPASSPNDRVQLVEGGGGYMQAAYRCDFDCLMRRKPNTPSMAIQDHISFCRACNQAILMAITGAPDQRACAGRPKLKSQHLVYDTCSLTSTPIPIRTTVFPLEITATSPSGSPTWRFNIDVDPANGYGLSITGLQLRDRPGDPFKAAADVCDSITFQDLSVQFDGGTPQKLDPAAPFSNTAHPPRLEQVSSSGDVTNAFLGGVKLTLTWENVSGWQIQAAFGMTVRDKRNDFDPGGAAEACKFYPQLALQYDLPGKGTGKLPKVTGLSGSIVLVTNNVIPTSMKGSLPAPLQMMANGQLAASLLVDSNNSDYDNSYTFTMAPASTTGAGITWLPGSAPAPPFGIWGGAWVTGRQLAGVINKTFPSPSLAGATARVAHLAAGYPGLPHWSWLFDYGWPDFTGTKQFTAVYRAGETAKSGGAQNIVRTLPVSWPPGGTSQMTVRKLPRQGAYDSLHVNASMEGTVAAPFCADLCLHLHWRWGTNALVGGIPSRLYAYRGWGSGSGDAGAGTIPGYPLIPPNQHLEVTAEVDAPAKDQAKITYAVSADQPDRGRWQVFLEQGIGFAFTYNGLPVPQLGLLTGGVGLISFGPFLTDFKGWVSDLQGLMTTDPATFDQKVRTYFMQIYERIRWYDPSVDKVTPKAQQIPGWDGTQNILPPGLEAL